MGPSSEADVAISESTRLNSDQVNYLIWRYLQESGYGEAAVKLQRDWKLDPQSLPLAKHVKGGALIRLIKYGLRYYYTDQTWDRRACKRLPLQSSMLYFGPEAARTNLQKDEDDAAGESETGFDQQTASPKSNSARKHPRQNGPNGAAAAADQECQPAPKRSRKLAADEATRDVTDQDQQSHQYHHEHQHQEQPRQQLLQHNAEIMLDDKMSIETDQPASHANSASSGSVPPAPEAKSPSPSDLDQDTDMMDMGVNTNGVAQDFEVQNGALNDGPGIISTGVFEPQDQDEEQMNDLSTALVPTLDAGLSVGVQFAPSKTAGSEMQEVANSIILHVADNQHVTNASWRPTDPAVLAASGTDFVGVWTMANQPARPGAVLPPFQNVINPRDEAMVSAMAWEPGGAMLAVAVFDHPTAGAIRIYDGQETVLIENLSAAQRLITALRWQKNGSRLVGFAASSEESSLVLWDLSSSAPQPSTFSIKVSEQINDISWESHGNAAIVCAAGDGVVYQCRAVPDFTIEHRWTSDSEGYNNWNFVRCSSWSEDSAIIVAAAANPPALWIPAKNVYAQDIHNGPLTCLDLRPGQMSYPDRDPYCDFATSSADASVKIWRYDDHSATIECLFKLVMPEASPIYSLSYTPDGHALAAASFNKVLVWGADKRGSPLARWEGSEDHWAGAYMKRQRRILSQGETMSEDGVVEEPEHSLTWDAESRKLAFALANQVAVITFQQ